MESKLTVAIHQPHYFPWIPYMNKIATVDIFVIFDNVQLPRGKSPVLRARYLCDGQEKWLTIPYGGKGGKPLIKDVCLEDESWKHQHWDKLINAYRGAPSFLWASELVNELLFRMHSMWLVDQLQIIVQGLCEVLGLKTRLVRASELLPREGLVLEEYIVALIRQAGATQYMSGMGRGSSRTVDEGLMQENGISVCYQDFAIPTYEHLHAGKFNTGVSILDALFMLGEKTANVVNGMFDDRSVENIV